MPDGGVLEGHLAKYTSFECYTNGTTAWTFGDTTTVSVQDPFKPTAIKGTSCSVGSLSGEELSYVFGGNDNNVCPVPGAALLPGEVSKQLTRIEGFPMTLEAIYCKPAADGGNVPGAGSLGLAPGAGNAGGPVSGAVSLRNGFMFAVMMMMIMVV